MSLHLSKCHHMSRLKIEPGSSIKYMLTCVNSENTNQSPHPYGLMGVLVFTLANTKALIEVRKLAKIRNRCNQVLYLTKDTTWESDKNTIKHHKREPRRPI